MFLVSEPSVISHCCMIKKPINEKQVSAVRDDGDFGEGKKIAATEGTILDSSKAE